MNATAERARLAQESQHFRDLISGRDMRISSLESMSSLHEKLDSLRAELDALHDEEKSRLEAENAHLEAENTRLERLMLDHSTQVELELKRFQKLPTGS